MSSTEPINFSGSLPRRPLSVTLLILGVLSISAFNLIRGYQAIRQWDFISEFLSISPVYLASSGLIWGAAGLVICAALWLHLHWAPRLASAFALVYSLYYWVDRLLVSSDKPGTNFLFTAIFNLALLVSIWWILSRPKAKVYFGVVHER